MVVLFKIALVAVLVIAAVLTLFNYGPYILEWFTDKVDEWEEILGSLEDEK